MKRVIDIKPLERDPPFCERVFECGQHFDCTRDGDAAATIDACNYHGAAEIQFLNQRNGVFCVGEDRAHRAETLGSTLQLAAVIDDLHGRRQ